MTTVLAQPAPADLIVGARAMASEVTLRVVRPTSSAQDAVDAALAVFGRVEVACTRFDPTSPLMRANADPDRWHAVPAVLRSALTEAARAHEETAGLFDPRVLKILTGWGYDRSLPFEAARLSFPQEVQPERADPPPAWRPEFRADGRVRLGPDPIDLGGIGKGLAVRWAAAELAGAGVGEAYLIDAGGDLYASGPGPDGDGWRIGVEDPLGGADPLAVLALTDVACATSSVRLRRWTVGGRDVHHLVDPRTGTAGGQGLLAVTVVHPDPAWAEVWSKSLFLLGPDRLPRVAEEGGFAALWVDAQGRVGTSPALAPHLLWQVASVA